MFFISNFDVSQIQRLAAKTSAEIQVKNIEEINKSQSERIRDSEETLVQEVTIHKLNNFRRLRKINIRDIYDLQMRRYKVSASHVRAMGGACSTRSLLTSTSELALYVGVGWGEGGICERTLETFFFPLFHQS